MDKAPDAYRTISEVGEDLDIAQHVLRFWETRFAQIKPLKRGGGRRYYRPDDVELLKGIRHLLYKEGYTIKGVQRILKEQGPRAVQAFARPPEDAEWQPSGHDAGTAPASEQQGGERARFEPVSGSQVHPSALAPIAAPVRSVAPLAIKRVEPVLSHEHAASRMAEGGPPLEAGPLFAPSNQHISAYPEAKPAAHAGLAEPPSGHTPVMGNSANSANVRPGSAPAVLMALQELEACRRIIAAALAR